jgi:chemotaxis protein CheD
MPDPENELAEVYLQPGEMFLAREPTIIRTLLGSCVGVTFWNERLGIGALCHAMLPSCPDGYSLGVKPEVGYRYVDFCIRDLARRFDELGARRSEVHVKLFGGADVLLGSEDAPIRDTVGSMNCDVAIEILRAEGLEIVASSLRGKSGLNIHFNTGNGEVHLRRLEHASEHPARRRAKEGRNS